GFAGSVAMADKDKKKLKKEEKEKVKAFKAAFKKQTGVESDSKDWGKLLAAFENQVRELGKWTVILGKVKPDEMQAGQERAQFWADKLGVLQKSAKTDLKWAGTTARDQLPVLLKVIEAVRKKAKNTPIKQQVGDREVSVYMTDIPGFAEMSSDKQKEAIELAAQKTARGLQLYEQISDGSLDVDNPNRVTRQGDAEALIWGLKSKAQEKLGGPYQKGAMTVPNGEKLRKYLDKCPEVYSRLSSHLREQQGRNVKSGVEVPTTEGQTPRGMDFYNPGGDDKPGSLPSGMNALLYQQMVLPGGEIALYVKMETEGSYGHPGDNRKLDSTVPPDRGKHPNDSARARKHLKNLLIPEKGKEDKDLEGHREQTPKEVVEAIKAVVSAVEGKKAKAYLKSSYGTEPKLLLLKKAVPRIAIFFDAVDKCRTHDGEDGWAIGDAAEDLLDKLVSVIETKFPADLLEGDRRMGEEIVVTEKDMAKKEDEDTEPEPDEDDDLDLDDLDEEEPEELKSELILRCMDLVEAVTDPELKKQLEKIYYEEVVDKQDSESFRHFSKMVGKSEDNKLGPRASKIADKLMDKLEHV
ncbi:MAG TPA: hypothetical protein VKS60_08040, partial [Stellaceae bacterium]|nr:hypothetical protein [Stellaceae bacterium]